MVKFHYCDLISYIEPGFSQYHVVYIESIMKSLLAHSKSLNQIRKDMQVLDTYRIQVYIIYKMFKFYLVVSYVVVQSLYYRQD